MHNRHTFAAQQDPAAHTGSIPGPLSARDKEFSPFLPDGGEMMSFAASQCWVNLHRVRVTQLQTFAWSHRRILVEGTAWQIRERKSVAGLAANYVSKGRDVFTPP